MALLSGFKRIFYTIFVGLVADHLLSSNRLRDVAVAKEVSMRLRVHGATENGTTADLQDAISIAQCLWWAPS